MNEDSQPKSDANKPQFDDDELVKAVIKIEKDPVAFCEAFLHIRPFPYQVDYLRDTSKRIVICAGRRVGKSVMTAARALWFALTIPTQPL